MKGNQERVLPLVDVSASMNEDISKNLNILDIAVSLGLYISERNIGPFKDSFITFSETPELLTVNGSLSDRYEQMSESKWGGSTDLSSAFKLILNKAVQYNVPQSEMPTVMIIFSDMEFNQSDDSWDESAHEMVERLFNESGYVLPKIVYWNLSVRNNKNVPVKFDKSGTVLVSGFSPSLLTAILSGKDMTPYRMMMDVIDTERYSNIKI
jgi:hypothetical protein